MEYLLILATLSSDGGLIIDVQETNLTLSQCEALITNPGQSCEADTSEALKGQFQSDDILLWPNGSTLSVVDKLDTKNRNPQPLPKGIRRVVTEALVL